MFTVRRRAILGLGPDFRKLFAASAVSNLGDGIVYTAAPLLLGKGSRARGVAALPPPKQRRFDAEEHREAFEEAHRVTISASTVGRAIARLPGGWPLKKSPE